MSNSIASLVHNPAIIVITRDGESHDPREKLHNKLGIHYDLSKLAARGRDLAHMSESIANLLHNDMAHELTREGEKHCPGGADSIELGIHADLVKILPGRNPTMIPTSIAYKLYKDIAHDITRLGEIHTPGLNKPNLLHEGPIYRPILKVGRDLTAMSHSIAPN